jgi:muramidase (phage lysozyme)
MGVGPAAAASSQSSQSSAAAGKWKPLLDLIASKESGGSYTKLYGGEEKADLTSMTLAEVDAFQVQHAKKKGSAAIGRYQFMNVLGQGKAAGLGPNDLFSPENQDKMAIQLIEGKRGVTMDMIKNNPAEAQLRLSKEWAALPKDESNLSYYHGDGRNKAHLTTAQMRETFAKMQTGGVVNMRGAHSNTRFTEAQKSFTESIAAAMGPPIVIVPPSGGGGGTTVVPTGSGQQLPPSLPDGPSSIQAAEYFYRLNMGSVY